MLCLLQFGTERGLQFESFDSVPLKILSVLKNCILSLIINYGNSGSNQYFSSLFRSWYFSMHGAYSNLSLNQTVKPNYASPQLPLEIALEYRVKNCFQPNMETSIMGTLTTDVFKTNQRIYPIPQLDESKKLDLSIKIDDKNSIMSQRNHTNPHNSYHLNSRKKFSPEEDAQLKKLVSQFGPKKWEFIARYLPGRTGRQCRDRYQNYLVPGFYSGQWTKEEDDLLYQKYSEIGPAWSKLSVFFPNRSANAIKNHWNYFVSRQYPLLNEINYPILQVNDKKDSVFVNFNNSTEVFNVEFPRQVEIFDSFDIFSSANYIEDNIVNQTFCFFP